MFDWVTAKLQNCSPIVGLDIGTTSIKLVELSQKAGCYQVEGYASMQLSERARTQDGYNTISMKEAIHSVAVSHKLRTKAAVIAVPDSCVFTKIIQAESDLNDTDIENFIKLEAVQFIPYSLSEVCFDFQVLGKNSQDSTYVDVLLVVARKENVDNFITLAAAGGVIVKIVDVHAHAIERAFHLIASHLPKQSYEQIIAFIELDSHFLTLIVMQHGNNIFTRSETFTENPSRFASFEDFLVLQIQNNLQFYFSNCFHGEIQQLFLAGDAALLPDLAVKVANKLKIEVLLANPFNFMDFAPSVSATDLHKIAPSLMLCCGLALRRFDPLLKVATQ